MVLYLSDMTIWFQDKLKWLEDIEEKIISLANELNIDSDFYKEKIDNKYGHKNKYRKFEIIERGENPQKRHLRRVKCAEGRLAAWTKVIIDNCSNYDERLKEIYIKQGEENGKEHYYLTGINQIYYNLKEYIINEELLKVENVNELLEENDYKYKWKNNICIHKEFWEGENIPVDYFYELKDYLTAAYVNTINNKFIYKVNEDGTREITRSE